MLLTPGQMLSQCRLEEKIGQRGMGIVYKALDTNLKRHVAIKILPPALLGNAVSRQEGSE